MRLGVYSIIDSQTGIYSHPFFQVTNGSAIRSFIDACSDQNLPFGKHPTDYALVHLGWFDDERAVFDTMVPVVLMTAVNALITEA